MGGQSVGGQLLFLRGWMDGDSSLCGFGPGSPPPTQRTRARGHLSADAAWEAEAALEF